MEIPGTKIEVDNFRSKNAKLFALTHYHSDHRKGLKRNEKKQIICSSITKKLLCKLHRISEKNIIIINPNNKLDLSDDIKIKAFDANHCHGAVMFLFYVKGIKYLYTGDFRYCKEHDQYTDIFSNIDTLFVDSIFKNNENHYNHPSQEVAISQIINLIKKNPLKKIYIGLYEIGKNKIIQAIYKRLGLKVYVNKKLQLIYSLIGMESAVTANKSETRIKGYLMNYFYHFFKIKNPDYKEDSIIILPTGWAHDKESNDSYYYIPYSEHCSSYELDCFVKKVNPKRIIETNV